MSLFTGKRENIPAGINATFEINYSTSGIPGLSAVPNRLSVTFRAFKMTLVCSVLNQGDGFSGV